MCAVKNSISPGYGYLEFLKLKSRVKVFLNFLAHLSRRLKGELIVYQSSCRLAVCLAVCLWTFLNLNISATSGPIVTNFYLNHHWGEGKAEFGFGLDRIGTLVSMATDSSHRVIMGEILSAL